MAVTNDKLLLLKSHECSKGLSDETLQEIADAAELVSLESGEFLHHANEALASVFLIVHGRLKQSLVDLHGNVLMERFATCGSQFGVLSAVEQVPVPVDVVAVEPSAALKFDFDVFFRFTRKHDVLGLNLIRVIASGVRDVLLPAQQPKKASLVALFHQSEESRSLTRRLVRRLQELGETPCVMSDRSDWDSIAGISYRALIDDGDVLSREEIRRQINRWSDSDRVIIDVDAAIDPVSASLLVEFADQVIWCNTVETIESSVYRLNAIEARAPGWRDKIHLVWTLEGDQQVAPPAAELRSLVQHEFKISFSERQHGQGRLLLDGFERLIHQLRGVRIGLALGGGGARGMAHLGVLKALEDNGIVVDTIAGTSAGAMTGIVYAAGMDPEYSTARFSEDLKPGWLFRMLPRGSHWYLLYKYRRGQFDRMLRKYLSDWTLEQMPLPIQSVTVDLVTGKPVVRDRGDAVHAILESINMPVFSQPICRDGHALVDGGLLNNIPADLLVKDGCNFVIAVNVTAKLESEFAKNRPDTSTADMASASILQTMLRSFLVQSVNMNSVGINPADIVIEPDVTSVDLSEFSRTKEMAAIGEKAALEVIPKIKSLLAKIDEPLFRG